MKILLFALVFCIVMIIPSAIAEEKVPDWVKNNAGWWASHFMSDNEFVNAIAVSYTHLTLPTKRIV